MELIKRAWRGQEKLWKVFWLYGFLGGIILSFVVGLVIGDGIMGFLVRLPFMVFILVSEWRCAWNAGAKFWGYIVRILVVLSVIGYLFMAVAAAGLMALLGASYSFKGDRLSIPATVPATPSAIAPATPSAAPSPIAPTTAPVDATAPASPVAAPTATAANPAAAACEKRMADYAIANHGDPKAYIAQNQAYLQQCIASGGK